MFVCSFKANKFKLFLSAGLIVLAAAAAIALFPETEHAVTVNGTQDGRDIRFDNVKTAADAVTFAESIGFRVDPTPKETAEVTIPSKFDAVTEQYNEIQKSQGFNLAKYKNKKICRYTFTVTALPGGQTLPAEGDVLLSLLVYKNKIIGGDVFYSGEPQAVGTIL